MVNFNKITPTPLGASSGAKLGKGFKKRLDMIARAKHRGVLAAAMHTAESTIKANEKTEGQRASTSYQKGRRFREVLIRTFGIATDSSGKVAEKVINEGIEANEKLKKQNIEQYGDPHPTIVEQGLHAIGEADQMPPFSRRWLFRGPKVLVRETAFAVGPVLLPWPLSCIVELINKFRDEKAP